MKNWRLHSKVINLIAALAMAVTAIMPAADAEAHHQASSAVAVLAVQGHASEECPTDAQSHHDSADMHCSASSISFGVDSVAFSPAHRIGEKLAMPAARTLEPIFPDLLKRPPRSI